MVLLVTNRVRAACLLALCVLGPVVVAQRKGPPTAQDGELVELDIVALDKHQQTVSDLRQDEFQIKENGRPVEIKTFEYVVALGSLQPDDARVVSLLMDDVGVGITGTSAMQQIAHALLSPLGRGDELSVVRLSRDADEAFGDFSTASDRIASYRGGMVPFSRRDTPETVLKTVAKISKQLEAVDHRRKAIICLGVTAVCDVEDPPLGAHSVLWPHWVALSVATWTGGHGPWGAKLAPFLVPPFRTLILNENGDFFDATAGARVARTPDRRCTSPALDLPDRCHGRHLRGHPAGPSRRT